MTGPTQEGLSIPGASSSPVPPIDQLEADETAAQAALADVSTDVATLGTDDDTTSALTSAASTLASEDATVDADTASLVTEVETD